MKGLDTHFIPDNGEKEDVYCKFVTCKGVCIFMYGRERRVAKYYDMTHLIRQRVEEDDEVAGRGSVCGFLWCLC